jgi:hypothetical protein
MRYRIVVRTSGVVPRSLIVASFLSWGCLVLLASLPSVGCGADAETAAGGSGALLGTEALAKAGFSGNLGAAASSSDFKPIYTERLYADREQTTPIISGSFIASEPRLGRGGHVVVGFVNERRVLFGPNATSAPPWGTEAGIDVNSCGRAINSQGISVGSAICQSGVPLDLPSPGGRNGNQNLADINDSNQVLASLTVAPDLVAATASEVRVYSPFSLSTSDWRVGSANLGDSFAEVSDRQIQDGQRINKWGHVVGTYRGKFSLRIGGAFLWRGSNQEIVDLGSVAAVDLNDAGQILVRDRTTGSWAVMLPFDRSNSQPQEREIQSASQGKPWFYGVVPNVLERKTGAPDRIELPASLGNCHSLNNDGLVACDHGLFDTRTGSSQSVGRLLPAGLVSAYDEIHLVGINQSGQILCHAKKVTRQIHGAANYRLTDTFAILLSPL